MSYRLLRLFYATNLVGGTNPAYNLKVTRAGL